MICRGLPWNRLLFICLFYQYLIITIMASSNPVGKKLISVEFEVSGKVQGKQFAFSKLYQICNNILFTGVFFRKVNTLTNYFLIL